MPLQIFPTFAPPGGNNFYPMLYYAPQWQPSDYSQQHHPNQPSLPHQKNSSIHHHRGTGQEHPPSSYCDPSSASFYAMPTLVPEQQPLYYTLDAHGNYVLISPSNGQTMTPLSSSLTHSDIGSTESDGMLTPPLGLAGRGKPSGKNKSPAYKTMMCNMYSTTGVCSYGRECQYAHGKEEIRPCLPHPKYKTQLCNKFNSIRGCQYGEKCHYLHPDDTLLRSKKKGHKD